MKSAVQFFAVLCCKCWQPGASADVLSEALLEDLLEDAARALWVTQRQQVAEADAEKQLQGPTLESMLLRMEEMEVSVWEIKA